MKRLVLHFAALLSAFTLGVGLDRVMSTPLRPAPVPKPVSVPVSVAIAEPLQTIIAPAIESKPSSTLSGQMIFDYDPEKFVPDGNYMIKGQSPKGFVEFRSISLWLNDIVDGQLSGSVAVHTVTTNDKQDYQTVWFGLVTERRLFFVTPTFEGGYEYRFDGEFLRRNMSSAVNTNKAVLRGTLTKTKKGRRVAEAVVSFRLEIEEDAC